MSRKWDEASKLGTLAVEPLTALLNGESSEIRNSSAENDKEIIADKQLRYLVYREDTIQLCKAVAGILDRWEALNRGPQTVATLHFYFVEKGVPESLLIEALTKYGDATMALDCLRTDNARLFEAAKSRICNKYGITINRGKDFEVQFKGDSFETVLRQSNIDHKRMITNNKDVQLYVKQLSLTHS